MDLRVQKILHYITLGFNILVQNIRNLRNYKVNKIINYIELFPYSFI